MADTSIPGRTRPDQIEDVRVVTSRGKLEAALLVILAGTAAVATTTDLRATPRCDQISEADRFITRSRVNPLITVLSFYPSDIVQGWDNFAGWPPPEPPFVQPQTHGPLLIAQTSYAAYAPATDIIYKQFRRTPWFVDEPPFIQEQGASVIVELVSAAPPPGDLTTLLRKPQPNFVAETFNQAWGGAWHIALMPELSPGPPTPPAPPTPVWPPPSAVTDLPARGCWELQSTNQALWVFGNGCYLMTVAAAPSVNGQATFAMTRVGTLGSNVGPVSIRDNGPGGYAVLVDGPRGYLYNIATRVFAQITDPAFLGADTVAFIDGWWIFNQPGTQVFYTPAQQYGTQFAASNFALKDEATDLLVAVFENKGVLWLIGERTTEPWYDAGGQYFAFARLTSTMLQLGCSAKASIARYEAGGDSGLLWLGKSERGENVVVQTKGFLADAVSSPAIANLISSFTVIADAIGYVYQEAGHQFYVLTFPTADYTIAYDLTTEMWHRRASYDPYAGLYHRHRGNCFLNFQNQRLVGDYQNGKVYRLDRGVYQDDIWPLRAERRSPFIWDGGARERVFMASLQIEFAPGVGNQSGMGTDPQAALRISRDGGTTWGSQSLRSMGKVGEYLRRTIWRRLGFARSSVVEVTVTDPVNRDVSGATLKAASGGDH